MKNKCMFKFKNHSNIAVLGRGPSLFKIEIIKEYVSAIILCGQHVNSMEILGKHILGKECLQVVMQKTPKIPDEFLHKYKINNIQTLCNVGSTERWVKQVKKYYPKNLHFYDQQNLIPVTSAGLAGVLLASTSEGVKNIYTCGIDFFQSSKDLGVAKGHYFSEEKNRIKLGYGQKLSYFRKMSESMLLICNTYPHINYIMRTSCRSLSIQAPNLTVIKIRKKSRKHEMRERKKRIIQAPRSTVKKKHKKKSKPTIQPKKRGKR